MKLQFQNSQKCALVIEEFSKFFEGRNFQIHAVQHGQIMVCFEFMTDNEKDLLELDKMTSTVIMLGGTIQPSNRAALDQISPYLAKRILGEFNLPLQERVKETFDPNLVLMGDSHLFRLQEQRSKSIIQKARENNKQVNFYLNKYF